MKYLKTFENFDMGRFSQTDADEQEWLTQTHQMNKQGEEECEPCGTEGEEEMEEEPFEDEADEMEEPFRRRVWGDEVVEGKKAKPDFLDLDKDGNKKESMKKAAKDAKEKKDDKKEEKGKGLSKAQQKLPEGLRKAIEAKKKK
jgi:hypothetical protein